MYAITSCRYLTGPVQSWHSVTTGWFYGTCLYIRKLIDAIDPEKMFESIAGDIERNDHAGLGAGAYGKNQRAV